MFARNVAFALSLASSCILTGCGGSSGSPDAGGTAAPAAAPAASTTAPAAPTVDRNAPCTWASLDEINRALGASLSEGTAKNDETRQITTCNFQQSSPFGILDIGLSLTPGADAFQTNMDLAPAYFDGDATPIQVAGAEKAYLVIKKGQKASVIGLLVNGRFTLIQVAIDSASADQATALAALLAGRMK